MGINDKNNKWPPGGAIALGDDEKYFRFFAPMGRWTFPYLFSFSFAPPIAHGDGGFLWLIKVLLNSLLILLMFQWVMAPDRLVDRGSPGPSIYNNV